MKRKTVGIVLFPDIEVLDFAGPFEVFSVTRLDETRRYEESSPFEVLLVAESTQTVTTTGGMSVVPHRSFADCPPLDILVVPGGIGTRKLLKHAPLLDWLRVRAAEVDTLSSVCTGSLLLGAAGLLNGKRATTHWRSLDLMKTSFPEIEVLTDQHVVEDGRVLTSAGISAGIDMALRVVTRYYSETVARVTAKHMEYPFPENNARRIRF